MHVHASFYTFMHEPRTMAVSDLFLEQRQSLIRKRLAASGRVLAGELAREFGVSEDTIRRDLRDMAAAGLCHRVYGGALSVSPASVPLSERLKTAPERNQALAETAIRFIEAGTTVFVDAGTTNLAIVEALPHNVELTVATNAPTIAAALLDRPAVELIVVGGRIDRHVGGAIGAGAVRDAEALRPDLCMLGACGIDNRAGLTAFSYEDAEFKRFIARRSRSVLAAATGDKIATAAPYVVMPLADCAHLIVEHDADEAAVTDLAATGIDIVRARPPRPGQ